MKLWIVVVAIGCIGCKREPAAGSGSAGSGSGSAAVLPVKPAPAPAGPVRAVATHDQDVQIIDIDATTAKLVASVKLPLRASELVWVGRDPIALLTRVDIPDASGDERLDGTVGTITAAGFIALPAPAATAWVMPHRPGSSHLHDSWSLVVTDDGEPWLAHCEWGGIEDGGHCDDWVWARIGRPVELTSLVSPPSGVTSWKMPSVAPATGYSITFAPRDDNKYEFTMTCKGGGKTTTLPASDHDPFYDNASLAWVSTDPPIFVVEQIIEGFMPRGEKQVFEGCEPSQKFASDAALFPGPDGLLVVASDAAMSIRRNGKELASFASGADHLVFRPQPLSDTSTFGVLEKQLANDTSVYAKDAVLFAPGPVSVGTALVPDKIKRMRFTSYNSAWLGDVEWLAAELQITTTGPARTYRVVELVDATGHVLVASFAPVVPLARGKPPAAITPTTPAGPLADFLIDPKAAAAAIADSVVVFGTDPGEHALSRTAAAQLLAGWASLKLARDPEVREVHSAKWGYAIANINYAKPGGEPYRMTALVIGAPDAKGAWHVSAIHYLSR